MMKYLKLGILAFTLSFGMISCDNDGPVEEAMEESGSKAEEVGEDIDNAMEDVVRVLKRLQKTLKTV